MKVVYAPIFIFNTYFPGFALKELKASQFFPIQMPVERPREGILKRPPERLWKIPWLNHHYLIIFILEIHESS